MRFAQAVVTWVCFIVGMCAIIAVPVFDRHPILVLIGGVLVIAAIILADIFRKPMYRPPGKRQLRRP